MYSRMRASRAIGELMTWTVANGNQLRPGREKRRAPSSRWLRQSWAGIEAPSVELVSDLGQAGTSRSSREHPCKKFGGTIDRVQSSATVPKSPGSACDALHLLEYVLFLFPSYLFCMEQARANCAIAHLGLARMGTLATSCLLGTLLLSLVRPFIAGDCLWDLAFLPCVGSRSCWYRGCLRGFHGL